jgi:hypothetical protein
MKGISARSSSVIDVYREAKQEQKGTLPALKKAETRAAINQEDVYGIGQNKDQLLTSRHVRST